MSNALVIPDVPAYLLAGSEAARARNLAAMGGIKAGGFPRISQGGGKFHLIEGDQKILITDPNNPELPAMQLEVVVVGFNPAVSKTYYEGDWEPGDADEPDCSSDNGVVPDPGVPHPQCTNCAACPQNVWGSKISKHNGKQIKACSDNKRLVIVRADDIAKGSAISLTITPGALKEWAEFVRELDKRGIEVSTVVVKVQFDPSVTFPKLVFKFGRYLTPDEIAVVRQREQGDDVRLIAAPKSTAPVATGNVPTSAPVAAPAAPVAAPAAPVAAPAAPVAAPAAPVAAPAAPVAAPVQAITPVVEDWKTGLAAPIIAAIESVGGPESPGGLAMMAQFKPAAAPATVEPEPAPDPFAGLPSYVETAVEAAGGFDSDAGYGVYVAMGGSMARDTSPATADKPKRKRRTKAEIEAAAATAAAPVQQAAAPVQQAAAPVQAAPSLAMPPAQPGGLAAGLDALLQQAMATPTA